MGVPVGGPGSVTSPRLSPSACRTPAARGAPIGHLQPTISSVLVSNGPPGRRPPTGPGSATPASMTFCRSPSPNGTIHRCSPVLRSMAVTREYGGFTSGSPAALERVAPRPAHVVELSFLSGACELHDHWRRYGRDIDNAAVRIYRRAGPVCPASPAGQIDRPAQRRRRKSGP